MILFQTRMSALASTTVPSCAPTPRGPTLAPVTSVSSWHLHPAHGVSVSSVGKVISAYIRNSSGP